MRFGVGGGTSRLAVVLELYQIGLEWGPYK